MIYKYSELLKKYENKYKIKKAIDEKKLFKVDYGLYSDDEDVNELEIITKKYPNAIFTLNSAFYFYHLTDVIPEKEYLATKRNALRIKDDKVNQVFVENDIFELRKNTNRI